MTMSQHPRVLDRREDRDIIKAPFTLAEVRGINRSRPRLPGKDQICYAETSRR